MRIIIAGSRTFDNYELLKTKMNSLLKDKDLNEITIVSGGANGADKLGERYAKENQLSLIICNANWDRYRTAAGYRRNKEMAVISHGLALFWDGKSKGSNLMKALAIEHGLTIRETVYTT